MSSKIRVAVLFGGRSAEHEVSLVSATSIINALDRERFDVITVGISPEGKWIVSPDALRALKEKSSLDHFPEFVLPANPRRKELVPIRSDGSLAPVPIDVVFPVLHGTYGEDGTVQGLLELADVPYIGSGVLGSAVGMDKVLQKQLLLHAGIPVTPAIWFTGREFRSTPSRWIRLIERRLKYPCFVKPANLGSSVGISKAGSRPELKTAIDLAADFDRKILVERAVRDAREIECSVLGNDDPVASLPGEILPSNEFYDYDAKYVDGKSQQIVPARLPRRVASTVRRLAVETFRTLEASGMARVDFLVSRRTLKVFVNEINTIPGFTSISMYPKLWEAGGLTFPKLLDQLIDLALERHREKCARKTRYTPKADWYRGN